jgi:hypothetical protein
MNCIREMTVYLPIPIESFRLVSPNPFESKMALPSGSSAAGIYLLFSRSTEFKLAGHSRVAVTMAFESASRRQFLLRDARNIQNHGNHHHDTH